jgi:adenylate cyclase
VRRLGRNRIAIFVLVGLAAIALTLAGYAAHILRPLELKTVDVRFDVRGSTGAPADLAVVVVDDETFNDLRNSDRPAQWPFPRCHHAKVIDQVAKAGPLAIAIDIQFTELSDDRSTDPATKGQYCDDLLVDSVERAGNVVLATTEVDENGRTAIFGGDDVLKQIGARPGNGVVRADSDGIMRRIPYEQDRLKTFGIVAAEVAHGTEIPRPKEDTFWIDFAGPPGTVTSYSFSRVMDGKVPASAFEDRLVVIGPSAPTLQDIHATSASGSDWMAGAEIQANIAETAFHGFPLRSIALLWNVALIVLLGFVAPVASLFVRGWRSPVIALVVGVLFAVASQFLFEAGWIVLVTYPLLALVLSAIGVLVVEYVLEAFDRVRTHDVFSRFVPETVVDQVLERTGSELRLGGERVTGTVMFTDLRGFTTFSEGLEAEVVIELLNGYLTEMSDAVLSNGGTLIAYLGDGLMAVFGAPLPQPDHADRALATAREMLEVRLPRFNETLRAQGFERGFKMGIGINTGEFMSGNVGSERRLEYTAIGDTINTASRIEGMTKGTPYALYLADSTREALTADVDDLLYVDEKAVRGRSQAIKLWSLSSPAVLKEDWQTEGGSPPTPEPSPAAAPAA